VRINTARRPTRAVHVIVTAAVASVLTLGVAGTASAGDWYRSATSSDSGSRLTVCAQDVLVRDFVGVLHHGQTFRVEGFDGGEWVYGFAYGDVNARGWVQNGWFC
jgi:hypothetical protein